MIRNRTNLDGDPAEHYMTTQDWLRARCDSTTNRLDNEGDSVLMTSTILFQEKAP
jgi:hypothetical protein